MSAVETIFQINFSLSNKIICPNEVMVIDQDCEQGILGECSLDFKWPAGKIETYMKANHFWNSKARLINAMQRVCKWCLF